MNQRLGFLLTQRGPRQGTLHRGDGCCAPDSPAASPRCSAEAGDALGQRTCEPAQGNMRDIFFPVCLIKTLQLTFASRAEEDHAM